MKPASRAENPTRRTRRVLADRQVQHAGELVALVAMVHGMPVQADVRVVTGRVGLVRDVAQRPGLRARAVQRALRARQRLDALDVDQPHFRLQCALRQRLLVEVDRGGGIRDEGGRVIRDAAEIDRAAPRGRGVVGETRDEALQVLDGAEVSSLHLLLADRLDLLRDIEQRLLALAGRDDYRLEVRGLVLREDCRRVTARQRHGNGVGDRAHRHLVGGFLLMTSSRGGGPNFEDSRSQAFRPNAGKAGRRISINGASSRS